jgi:dynein heavy chain
MTLESAIQSGYPVLIENVEETLDTAIESVLQKQVLESDNMKMIKLGGKLINYHPTFKLYMTTKLSNPHYLPEIFIKVTIINLSITFEGLQDQLLAEVMKHERPEIEKQRDEVVVTIATSKKRLEESQNKILELLAVSTGMILDDVVLIETLEVSKTDSTKIIKNIEATSQIE